MTMNRKRTLTLALLVALFAATVSAAPVKNLPVARIQPNGDTLRCYVSGDEFYQRLHDRLGYTIIQNVESGWYVYAEKQGGVLMPTSLVAGQGDPAAAGLKPGLIPDPSELKKRHDAWEIPEQYREPAPKTSGSNHGTLNNIVIFIRFSDESASAFGTFSSINSMFNDSTAGGESMFKYFKKASYNKLRIPTSYFPAPSGNTVISYQDTFPRNYFQPYSSTNTSGYSDDTERRSREFGLIQRAVNWVNANSPVPTSLNLDMDNDGKVDNICFLVSGTYTGWSELLWPHKWSLYDRNVYINSKRVYTFNLQLAGSGTHYFSVSTFCHEMTHTLGCPDLYHYDNYTSVSAAGSWDLMHSNSTPPQQTNSLFKKKYLNWFDSIPLLTDSGSYTMQSLGSGPNHAYKIASSNSHQWYILEYRNTADTFDSSIPNRGMLIWRYNDLSAADNASFDNGSTPHELWLFRPGSNDDTTSGTVSAAAFGVSGRNAFSSTTNPHPYLCNGTADTSFSITNIAISADYSSVSFTFNPGNGGPTCPPLATFPHQQGFESGDVDCWTFCSMDDANDGRTGAITATSSTQPHSGSYMFAFSSYSRATDYNQYLLSPRLQHSSPLHFGFYYRKSNNQNESFAVKYSTTNNQPSSFTNTLATQTVSSTGWHYCDVLVPANANYVTINYNSNYAYYLYIDDIFLRDTLNEEHDTTYLYVHDTLTRIVYDTLSRLVHDTIYSRVTDTAEYVIYDTLFVELEYARLEVVSTDSYRGGVSGSGHYPIGGQVQIAALPNRGYRFARWQDGSTANPRTVTIGGDVMYMASFESLDAKTPQPTIIHDTIIIRDTTWIDRHDTVWVTVRDTTLIVLHDTVWVPVHQPFPYDSTTYFTLTVRSADSTMGFVAGSGRFPIGTEVEVGAGALPGFKFYEWSNQSATNPLKVRLTADLELTATFVVDQGETVLTPRQTDALIYTQGASVVVKMDDPSTSVEILNILGQRVYSAVGSFTSSPLRPGVYLVRVQGCAAKKVVVAQH